MQYHPQMPTAEAEVKIRLSADEFRRLPAVLEHLGFRRAGEEALTDYYLEYARSSHGSYDFVRLRAQGDDHYLLTQKRWMTDAQGHQVRAEEERDISAEEAAALRAHHPQAPVLRKTRTDFRGQLAGKTGTVSLDALELNGAPHYFLEAELLVPVEEGAAAREAIYAWMREQLPVQDFNEAPSMLELLLEAGVGETQEDDR